MKLFPLLAFFISSCVNNPSVEIVTPDGTKTKLTTGSNFMAEVDEQVSEVEGGGYHLRHMVKRQDATRVPIAVANLIASVKSLGILGRSEDLKTVTDGDVAKAGIAADVTKTTATLDAANKAKELDNAFQLAKP